MRVCLDTNVLIAALATRGLGADVFRLVLAEHDLVIGEVILEEMRRVLATKFKVPADRIESIAAVFAPFPCLPKPATSGPAAIRDPADRWVFATALAGNAEVLVTGDQDLLTFHDQTSIRILTPRAFWELVRSGAG